MNILFHGVRYFALCAYRNQKEDGEFFARFASSLYVFLVTVFLVISGWKVIGHQVSFIDAKTPIGASIIVVLSAVLTWVFWGRSRAFNACKEVFVSCKTDIVGLFFAWAFLMYFGGGVVLAHDRPFLALAYDVGGLLGSSFLAKKLSRAC